MTYNCIHATETRRNIGETQMLEDLRLTKAEREAIENGYYALRRFTRSDYELDNWAKQERSGYGNSRDKIPLICARALLVKWFLQGVKNPDVLLREAYMLRPAAIYFEGLGAFCAKREKIMPETLSDLEKCRAAYEAAFQRMHERDLAAIRAMQIA